MANRRYNPEKHVRKEIQSLGKATMRELRQADRDYQSRSGTGESSLLPVLLKLLGALCLAAIILGVWALVGWFALFVPVFVCLVTRSVLWAVIVPLGFVLLWLFLL
jgi:Flp pilus assembly protein TadB